MHTFLFLILQLEQLLVREETMFYHPILHTKITSLEILYQSTQIYMQKCKSANTHPSLNAFHLPLKP